MYGDYGRSDEDMITCPDCGHREYPGVGFSIHNCPAGDRRHEQENAAFERSFVGSGHKVRTVIVMEHYDTEAGFRAALDMVYSRDQEDVADSMLGVRVAIRST